MENEVINKFIDRFEIELNFQKEFGYELIRCTFTRSEIISLRIMLNTLKDLLEEKNGKTNLM